MSAASTKRAKARTPSTVIAKSEAPAQKVPPLYLIRARCAEDDAKAAVDDLATLREKVTDLYEGFVTHVEGYDDEPDLEEKCDYADALHALHDMNRKLGHLLSFVSGCVAELEELHERASS